MLDPIIQLGIQEKPGCRGPNICGKDPAVIRPSRHHLIRRNKQTPSHANLGSQLVVIIGCKTTKIHFCHFGHNGWGRWFLGTVFGSEIKSPSPSPLTLTTLAANACCLAGKLPLPFTPCPLAASDLRQCGEKQIMGLIWSFSSLNSGIPAVWSKTCYHEYQCSYYQWEEGVIRGRLGHRSCIYQKPQNILLIPAKRGIIMLPLWITTLAEFSTMFCSSCLCFCSILE